MPRPRSTRNLSSAVVYWKYPDPLPPAIRKLLNDNDPALASIINCLSEAAGRGEDVSRAAILDRCISEGRVAFAAAQLGVTA